MTTDSLSDMKFWVRDYDLDNLKQQILEGKDDCIVHWKDAKEKIQNVERRIKKELENIDNHLNSGYAPKEGIYKYLKKEIDKIFKEEIGGGNEIKTDGKRI